MSQQDSLTDVAKLIKAETALLCARLYLRDGKRHLQEGAFKAGIAELYEAILFGMQYYIAEPAGREKIDLSSADLWDHAVLYHKLVKTGLFDDLNALNHLSQIVERALWQGAFSLDVNYVIAEIETMLSKLGVTPFNESILQNDSLAIC